MEKIHEIKHGTYQGYLWMSDSDKPVVYSGGNLLKSDGLELIDDKNPFVIEGQLYDADTKISVSIKYVDGHYIVKDYSVADDNRQTQPDEKKTVKHKYFQGNKMDGQTLHFHEVWRPEADILCEGMHVLRPAELIFVGFENRKENKS